MTLILPSARRLSQAALFVAGFAAALTLVGCAQKPVQADAQALLTPAITTTQFREAVNLRRGLCIRKDVFCLPPIPVPVWQAPLLARETVLKPPLEKAERLPVGRVCQFKHDPGTDGSVRSVETCVLLYEP